LLARLSDHFRWRNLRHARRPADRPAHAQGHHSPAPDRGGGLFVAQSEPWRARNQGALERHRFDLIFGLALGFYDGFFGPGTGTFWTMAFVLAMGFNLTRATAYTKAMNFSSNVCSVLVFALAGQVNYLAGTVMGIGQLIGARFGSRMVMKRGTKFIRPVFITVVLTITVKLLYDAYFR
jgi:uncharacterized membrane protein YfcA